MGVNKKGNTARVTRAKAKTLPIYPELDIHHSGRVFTKHFTNLSYTLNWDQLILFQWLCHESTGYNVFSYNLKTIKKYQGYVRALRKKYPKGMADGLNIAVYNIREVLIELIEMGAVFNTEVKGEMFINPNLSYRPKWFNGKLYKQYVTEYNNLFSADRLNDIYQVNQKAINKIKETQSIYKK